MQLFTRIGLGEKRESIFKREDISTIAEIAEEEGVIEEKDSLFIKNIVKLQNVKVKDIMTPFSVMKIADQNSTINDFYNQNNSLEFSRIPIYYQNTNKISSYVLKDTILEKMIQKKGDLKLNDIKRKIIKTTIQKFHNSKVPILFDKLLRDREHLSLVIDKQKKIKGIVTLRGYYRNCLRV